MIEKYWILALVSLKNSPKSTTKNEKKIPSFKFPEEMWLE